MAKFVAGASYPIARALIDAGLISEDERYIKRILIDLRAGKAATITVEHYADDERMIDWLTGVEWVKPRVEQATSAPGETR